MSVHFWGEDPKGVWTLAVTDNPHNNRQHHRYKTRFGDTEDATASLQDEMNGDGHDGADFKSTEDFEDNIFKDSSFKPKKVSSNHLIESTEKVREKSEHIKHESKVKHKHPLKVNDVKETTDDNESEVKILEELLGVKETHDSPKEHRGILNSSNTEIEKPLNQSVTHSHDDNLLKNISSRESEGNVSSQVNKDYYSPSDVELSEGAGVSETKMLESLLRGVISQVFSNFLQSNTEGSKSFDQRLSMLESLLGKKPEGEDDKVIHGLMDAFQSGKAIDRVNNVLGILEDSKNNTQFTNTSFSRNADVVVDVLKVLKDVLNTEKGDKSMKDYKQRVSNLLEQQSGDTNKITKKLLSDLKLSGTDSSDVVNDALLLIRRIFQSEKKKSEKRNKKNHKKKSNAPKSYEFTFQNPSLSPLHQSDVQKEITKSKQTKEIQHSENDVEKITVERVKVKNPKKLNSQNLRKVLQNPLFEEDSSNKRERFQDIDTTDLFKDGTTQSSKNRGFTLTITKNGEKISERDVDDVQAFKLLQSTTQRSIPQVSTTIGEKKQAINRDEGRKIDVEVLVDGASESMYDQKSQLNNTGESNEKVIIKKENKTKAKKKKSKQTTVKKIKKSTKIKNSTLQKIEENEDEAVFPIFPFNENDQSFSGEANENFIPTSFSQNFEYPIVPTTGYQEPTASFESYRGRSFDPPVKNPAYDIDKRSRLMANPSFYFPYFPFYPPSSDMLLSRNFRSLDEEEMGSTQLQQTHFSRQRRENTDTEYLEDYKRDENEIDKLNDEEEISNPRSGRLRRNVDDATNDAEERLIRRKRNDSVDEEENGEPHVVKRSAIFSDFYSPPPSLMTGKTSEQVMTNSEKRSAIRKALSLERSLKKRLRFSKGDTSSSEADILRRVHTDIAKGDAKDLRILEKELSRMKTFATEEKKVEQRDSRGEEDNDPEPINSFMKLVEQTENSSARKTIPEEGSKPSAEEYFKYGTSASGILVSWTMKFYGT